VAKRNSGVGEKEFDDWEAKTESAKKKKKKQEIAGLGAI
jgi:hypothetical protein